MKIHRRVRKMLKMFLLGSFLLGTHYMISGYKYFVINSENYDNLSMLINRSKLSLFQEQRKDITLRNRNSNIPHFEFSCNTSFSNASYDHISSGTQNKMLSYGAYLKWFSYPLDVDMTCLVNKVNKAKEGKHVKKAINIFTHKFLQSPSTKCDSLGYGRHEQDLFILFIVKSSHHHWKRRLAIRQTWGNEKYMTFINIRTLFTIGISKWKTDNSLEDEIHSFDDIIYVDFVDSYYNNTFKTMSSIRWASTYCTNAKYIVLTDDDYFVSLENLIQEINSLSIGMKTDLYMGSVIDGRPIRNESNKWFVSLKEYPYEWYPPFVRAGTIIMSMDFIMKANIAMEYVRFFRLDDVFLGFIAYRLKTKVINHASVHPYKVPFLHYSFQALISAHGYTPIQIRAQWRLHKQNKQLKLHTLY